MNQVNSRIERKIISDNASPDETGAVVERIRQKTRTTINYFRNDRNVGFDGNILLAVGRARGRYVWLMGDDDLLAEGALEHIVREIKTTDGVDLFFGEKEDFLLTPDRPVRTRKMDQTSLPTFLRLRNLPTVRTSTPRNHRKHQSLDIRGAYQCQSLP